MIGSFLRVEGLNLEDVLREAAGLDARSTRTEMIDGRFVPIIESLDGSFEIASQDIFHDLTPLTVAETEKAEPGAHGVEFHLGPLGGERTRTAMTWVRLHVQHPMVKEQQRRRADDARIRREYLERAFESQINRLRQREFDLLHRQASGEPGAAGRLALLSDDLAQVEMRKTERMRAIDRLGVARGGDVRHLATVVVLPVQTDSEIHHLMHADPEVERVAMECAMAEERRRGWEPADVSQLKDGRGYDILSTGPADPETGLRPARRIEVKGRSSPPGPSGDVGLSRNEWIKAARLGKSYWLYVAYDARPGATPKLVAVQDPANALASASEEILVVKGYRLPGNAILAASRSPS